jgi:PAS domain S-box-containing protein
MNDSSRETSATILIVDDDELVRRSLQSILEHQGHHCCTVGDGLEGLEILRAGDYDVALIDMNMPSLDGLGLLSRMRESQIRAVPLVLTGFGEVTSAVEAMKLGAFDYLAKPPNYSDLIRAVARAVEHSRARRHARIMEDLAAQWEATFDACPDLMAILDPQERVLRCNQALASRLGVAKAKLVGQTFSSIFEYVPGDDSFLGRTLNEGGVQSIEARCDQLRGVFIITLAPLRNSDGRIFGAVCVAQDITERKQAEEARALLLTREQAAHAESDRLLRETRKRESELRDLAFELSSTEDRERRNLALSLHDSLGQMLSVVKLKLTGLQREAEGQVPMASGLDKVLELTDQLIQQTRDLTFDLYPAMLDDLGLVPTLQWYRDQFSRQTGIRMEVSEIGQSLLVPTPIQTFLFRAVKELLHNVAKHARAKEVVLTVRWQRQSMRIMVADDGCGVDMSQFPDHHPPRGGLGLVGIRERIGSMGGEFGFESWPGRGTQVLLEVPLSRD